ncbi:hypothetical protein G4Z16_00950 [Streptomyces bathyalis]|uniref:Uncharacterized protein n=1 Tax=Streptomyces bathyalis TaxID=2710756 RepID=A0A7T1T2G9_9ACTN|nr:hypothetical protein [Streptomyces bathyalis]QPP05190.1 hypothetical protein G4Z16_00950 [Streptomyces bathyalis]
MTTNPPSLHQLRLRQLAVYLREAEQVLADWDLYSDQNSTLDGWPIDDVAYGLRQRQRDADTWRAFRPLLYDGHHLLDGAQAQLARIPQDQRSPHWGPHLAQLRQALEEMRALQSEWTRIREALPESARPGTRAYDEPLTDRNAEAWSPLVTWADDGLTLINIDVTAELGVLPRERLAPAPALNSPPVPGTSRRRSR